MAPEEAPDRDQFSEAMRLLDRATTPRERLRDLEAVRSALRLELRDFARARTALRSPDEAQLAALERNVEEAWLGYEAVAGGSLDVAYRALQGIREAVATLREATAKRVDDPVLVRFETADGTPITTWVMSAERIDTFQGIPQEYRTGDFTVTTQLHFHSEPDVLVHDSEGKLVWRRPPIPEGPGPPSGTPP